MTLKLGTNISMPDEAITETFGVLNEAQHAAWFAGLFEGEGCIINRLQGRSDDHHPEWPRKLFINSTDLDVLERAQRLCGCGSITERKKIVGNRKRQWNFQISRWREINYVGRSMLPYLCSRRRTKLLSLLNNPPTKSLGYCPNCATPFSGPNADVYRKPNGQIQCAPCTRNRMRIIYHRKKQ